MQLLHPEKSNAIFGSGYRMSLLFLKAFRFLGHSQIQGCAKDLDGEVKELMRSQLLGLCKKQMLYLILICFQRFSTRQCPSGGLEKRWSPVQQDVGSHTQRGQKNRSSCNGASSCTKDWGPCHKAWPWCTRR